jgi:hypothetical protein
VAGAETVVLVTVVAALGPDRGRGGREQGGLEEQVAFARRRPLRLAGALEAARRGPGRQAPGGGERAHVDADLGEDGGRRHPFHARDLHQQPVLSTERLEVVLDPGVERLEVVLDRFQAAQGRRQVGRGRVDVARCRA